MCEVTIRRAKFKDIPQLDKLLFEVHKIHSDIRPDLFTVGEKKYTDEELEQIIVMSKNRFLLQKITEK